MAIAGERPRAWKGLAGTSPIIVTDEKGHKIVTVHRPFSGRGTEGKKGESAQMT